MSGEPRVAIVVLNWNGRDDTLACLASVSRIVHQNLGVIVVDNGSSDGSVAAIRDRHPRVEVIETGRNLGFAGGNNAGIRRALELGADFVLLLNNDTEVDAGLVDAFVAAAHRHPEAGAFGARIYFHADPRRIWHAGTRWNNGTAGFEQIGEGELDDGQRFAREGETAYACGCAMFIPTPRLRQIGLLDERYFLYFEETDWCYRARAAGHPSIYVPDARLWHKVSVSVGGEGSPLMLYFVARNRLLWASRHGTAAQRRAVRRSTWNGLWNRFAASARPGSGGLRAWWWAARAAWREPRNRAVWLGVRDHLLGRYGDCPSEVRALAAAAKARTRPAARPPAAAAQP
jgi:GT2 family glycosyltransferase